MKKWIELTMEQAVTKTLEDEQPVYMLVRMDRLMPISDFEAADSFITFEEVAEPVKAEPKPKTKPQISKIDHAKIVALYTANPPRSVAWIADDMGISQQTVINHLTKEGIYKTRSERKDDNAE